MALSEEEERRLREIAERFYADDPKLASTLAPGGFSFVDRARASGGVLLILFALGLLVLAVSRDWTVLGVGAFLAMLSGAVLVYTAVRGSVTFEPPETFNLQRLYDKR